LAEIETKLAPDNVESLKKKQIRNFEKEKVELTAQLETLQNKKINGWVLCDFPCTYAQAKLLE
jgi:U3 small nucleolar ribonucleoprotein component